MTRSQPWGTAGFTLIEVLAALAIASVVIVATAALIHNVALNFDRGTGTVGRADRLLLAVQRLAADFGSARLVPSGGQGHATGAFAGSPTQIKFVAAGGVAAGPQGEEVISLTVEESDGTSRLVRRRAAWRGPRTLLDSVMLRDPVNLIDGRIDIAFAFARIAADGTTTWSEAWSGQPLLPRMVRLTVRDRASGADLIPGAQFVLRADAPIGCAQSGAKATCLAGDKPQNEPAKEPAKDSPDRGRG
ncbi:prepilin-type N-terminal cleavage/methylation domain-containing protein [Bradyrhizobium prioriisuperbiae]|uniref:PulJ/GspJ family protein n=1 Tax=Bradyrhizobium prioriisuperbiae TaxID=2854389 RepID=UPI0028EB4D7F|nr:prepilin-type N-terminal cleavage/methylation domain-containing protein [Bradyrhizobium prioritasuperba]